MGFPMNTGDKVRIKSLPAVGLLLTLAIIAAACGGGEDATPTPTQAPAATATPTPTRISRVPSAMVPETISLRDKPCRSAFAEG